MKLQNWFLSQKYLFLKFCHENTGKCIGNSCICHHIKKPGINNEKKLTKSKILNDFKLRCISFRDINVDSCQLTFCFYFSAHSLWESACGFRLSIFIPRLPFAYIFVCELECSYVYSP